MHPPTHLTRIAFAVVTVGLALPLFRGFEVPPGSAPQHLAVVASAWVAAVYWYVGAALLTASLGDEYPDGAARAWWSAGCGLALLHVALAFHAAHGWSHGAAYRHTAEMAGFGAGVFVNYLFLAVWVADVAWLWVAPRGYQRRPRWASWAVHGFLAFVVFNATVVFGSGAGRWVAAAAFAWMAWELKSQWHYRSRSG